MGVLHSSFLPEHHDTHGKIYFLRKMIIDIDGGTSYIYWNYLIALTLMKYYENL